MVNMISSQRAYETCSEAVRESEEIASVREQHEPVRTT